MKWQYDRHKIKEMKHEKSTYYNYRIAELYKYVTQVTVVMRTRIMKNTNLPKTRLCLLKVKPIKTENSVSQLYTSLDVSRIFSAFI
jgi:hypothetical protein